MSESLTDTRSNEGVKTLNIAARGQKQVTVATPSGHVRHLRRSGLEGDDVAWQRCAEECGLTLDTLRDAVRVALAPAPPPPAPPEMLYVREAAGRKADARTVAGHTPESLREAFALPRAAWVEWDSAKRLAVLDVDWHGAPPPAWAALELALLGSTITPAGYWRSRSGGLHAVFVEQDGIHADELAAACAVALLESPTLEACTGIEVLARTGVPPARAPQAWQAQQVRELLPSWRRRELVEPDAEAIEALREERGWLGRDAEHTACPFAAERPSSVPGRRPVYFSERGVLCLSCQAHGGPSFVSWATLVHGEEKPNRVLECAEGLACWSHARFIIADAHGTRLAEPVQRLAYFALCKRIHGADDPRIPRLARSEAGDFVRGLGCWLDPRGFTPVKPVSAYYRSMPSNTYVDAEGRVGLDTTAASRCENTGDLPGFPPILPVRGAQVWGTLLPYASLPRAVRVSHYTGPGAAPRYRDASQRDMPAAWAELQSRFPGLRADYLRLLLVARGFAESGEGRVPRVLTIGPSGSAKSTTVQLAAAILGDRAELIADDARTFREAFDNATANGIGYLLCDELGKPLPRRLAARRTSNPFAIFLPLESREYTARLMYIGPVRTRMQSAVVITGTQVPDGMEQDRQLARRFVCVRLHETVPSWDASCGFGDATLIRAHLADACDAIWSEVVDDFFSHAPAGTFEHAAARLGFSTLAEEFDADGADSFSAIARVRELFDAVCAGEASSELPSRWKAKGRRKWGFFDEAPAPQLWRELCDGFEDGVARFRSERVSELDLRAVLGVTGWPGERVWLEARGDHRVLCLRFGVGPQRAPLATNAEMLGGIDG